jgi:hypothetical protein
MRKPNYRYGSSRGYCEHRRYQPTCSGQHRNEYSEYMLVETSLRCPTDLVKLSDGAGALRNGYGHQGLRGVRPL